MRQPVKRTASGDTLAQGECGTIDVNRSWNLQRCARARSRSVLMPIIFTQWGKAINPFRSA